LGFPLSASVCTPAWGPPYFLPRIVGVAKAYELLTTCEAIDAAEAQRIGLVSYRVPAEELIPFALRLARKIASMPLLTTQMVKESIYAHLDCDLDAALVREAAHQSITFTTEDIKEGIAALREKRPPHFKETL